MGEESLSAMDLQDTITLKQIQQLTGNLLNLQSDEVLCVCALAYVCACGHAGKTWPDNVSVDNCDPV